MHTRCARRLQLNIHFLHVNYQQYICTIKKSKPYNLLLWWWLLFLWIFSFHLEGKKCISKHMLDPKIERNSKCFFHIFADRLIDTKADWNHQATMRRIKEMENSLLFSIFMWSLCAKKKIPVKIQKRCTNSVSHIIKVRWEWEDPREIEILRTRVQGWEKITVLSLGPVL